MSARHCGCGYPAADGDDLLDHLLEVVTPDDDRSPDGVPHAEAAAAAPGRECLCGFAASGTRELDAHFLASFSPPDGMTPDGKRHVAMPLT